MLLRKKGLSYSEIGKMFGVSKQNVYAIEKRTRARYKECKLEYEVLTWAFSVSYVVVRKGESLSEAVEKLFKVADGKRIKVVGSKNEIYNLLKLKSASTTDASMKDMILCLMEDGRVEVLDEDALRWLRQHNLIDGDVK